MRKALLMLALAACATSPLALAQDTGDDGAAAARTTAADTPSPDATELTGKPKSAFGRVMSLLTHALQQASTGKALDMGAAGVTVTVTPVTGRATLAADADNAPAPPSADAVATGVAPAAARAPLAVQTGDGGAD